MPDGDGAQGEVLWIPVAPETSQFGPKMQEAGKKSKEEFLKGAKDFGKGFLDEFRKDDLGKKIGADLIDGLTGYMKSHDIKGAGVLKDSMTKAIEGASVGKAVGEEVTRGLTDYLNNSQLTFTGAGVLKDSIADALQGREVGEIVGTRIGEGLGGWLADANFTGAGVLRDSIVDIFKGRDAGVVIGEQLGKGIGDWLNNADFVGSGVLKDAIVDMFGGKDIADNIADRIHEALPESLRKVLDSAVDLSDEDIDAALSSLKTSLEALAKGDIKAGVDQLSQALELLGIDIDSLPKPIRDVLDEARSMSDTFSGTKDVIEDFQTILDSVRDKAPGIVDALEKIAGPMLEIAGARGAVDWVQNHLPESMQGREPNIDKDLGPNQGKGLSGKDWGHDFSHPWEIPQRIWRNFFGRERGGPLDGPGAKGRDSIFMLGAPGEHMWTADEVDGAGGHEAMYALRALARKGLLNLPGFQGGGEISAGGRSSSGPSRAIAYADSMSGTPYSQALRNDCSGMVSQVVNAYLGLPPRSSLMTTRNEAEWLRSKGFQMGLGPAGTLRVGWYNHGSAANDGHTAMTLPDGQNAESGGSHGNFLVGAGAAGADSPMFDHHAWLPENPQGEQSGSDAGGGGWSTGGGGGGGSAAGGGGGAAGGGGGGGAAGGAGGGAAGGGGGGLGGDLDPKSMGKSLASGLMEELGLDGSVFKNPLDFPIPKLGMGLMDVFTDMAQKQGGASKYGNAISTDPGIGGLSAFAPNLSTAPNVNAATQIRGDRDGGGQVSVTQDNSFHVHGVGTVAEQQEQYNARNASPRSVPNTVVNGGVMPHGG